MTVCFLVALAASPALSTHDANALEVLPGVWPFASWLLLLPDRLRKRMMTMSLKYFPGCDRLLPGAIAAWSAANTHEESWIKEGQWIMWLTAFVH